MKRYILITLGLLALFHPCHARTEIEPAKVAILFNSSNKESQALALSYAEARQIPKENIVGLPMSDSEEITRAEFEKTIEIPLRTIFKKNNWWKMGQSKDGTSLAVETKINVLVTMRGVPLKISRKEPFPLTKGQVAPPPKTPIDGANEASVDSELALLSVIGIPTDGPARNPFFENKTGIIESQMPFMLLVGRIDGPDLDTCKRMIKDAIDTEKTGLWGRGYYDLAQFYPDGDTWIRTAAYDAADYGFPTDINTWKETYPLNYPMREAALYFGWYEGTVCGPFKKTGALKKGSVAVHLHSFSASTVRSTTANWCGPLLAAGAAATLGNVYEPYLHLSHRLDIFQRALLEGSTLVEAAYTATPIVSWQGVILGDPLYRPFIHIDVTGERATEDRPYRALRAAKKMHKSSESTFLSEIADLGKEKKNPYLLEALGLIYISKTDKDLAIGFLNDAKTLYTDAADQLRCDLQIVGLHRNSGRTDLALVLLNNAAITYSGIPEVEAIRTLRNILDPPPPPPVQNNPQK